MTQPTDWTFTPYSWRGRTYRTLLGLCRAVLRTYPGGSVSFGADEMQVRYRNGSFLSFYVDRGSTNAIDAAPNREGGPRILSLPKVS